MNPKRRTIARRLTLVVAAALISIFPNGPAVSQGPALGDALDLGADLAMMAGGAVRFSVPQGWSVVEIPHGRQVRLWVTPGPTAKGRPPQDGIWMTFHWRDREVPRDELHVWLQSIASGLAAPPIDPSTFETRRVGRWQAVAARIDHGTQRDWRMLISTSTGVLEIAVTASTEHFAARRRSAERLLQTLTVTAPRIRRGKVASEVTAATNAVGLWKSLRGRLRLSRTGRVEIRFDGDKNFPLDESGSVDYRQRIDRLTGRYQAHRDTLMVTWDDGSRLNYRWRVEEGQLLLTDHNGRVSQLTRLID